MWVKEVDISSPYDFNRVLGRLSLDPLNQVDVEAKMVNIPLYIDNERTIATVRNIGTINQPSFIISGEQSTLQDEVMRRLNHLFQWNVPLQKIADHFKQTNLNKLFEEHRGTPLVLDFNLYGCLMKCIIHQQLNLKFAFTLTERFVKTFGSEVDGVWFYPLPEQIAELSYDMLRELQFSQRKAEYVIDTSRLISEGKLNLDELINMSDEDVISSLVKIRGIGPWTAQNVLLFELGRKNLFPKADIGIQNALKKYFSLDDKPTKDEMDELSEKWAPYLSYASLYLWRSIENS
ncbi:DNA-3-methyladenine glycosylase family protein [Cytobacillus sp. Hm23]